MNELKVFKNEEFGEVRSLVIDNEPWFVGKDILVILQYKDLSHAILDHVDEDDRINSKTQGQNNPEFGQRGTWLINESGLYSLILSSKLPKAKEFKHWVTSEVLPTIRKTGGYVQDEELFVDSYFPNIGEHAKNFMATTLRYVKDQNKTIDEQREEIEYKEDVIVGLVDNISVANKRQILNRVVRKGGKYQERWNMLYREFENKYFLNLSKRINNYNDTHKPKIKNKLDYIDKVMNKVPELYEIACKLFENDIEKFVKEMYEGNNISSTKAN